MQKLISTFLILFPIAIGMSSAHADLGTKLRTSPFLRTAAFRAVQVRLCNDYRKPAEFAACLRAGAALRKVIAFSTPLSSTERERLADALDVPQNEAKEIAVTAIHTDRLKTLLHNPSTARYLKDLTFYHQYDPTNFNLWDMSIRLSTSPEMALERVAVLFQDLSQSREHLKWAIAKGLPEAAIENLLAANEPLIERLKIGFEGESHPLPELKKFYPAVITENVPDAITPGIYHFYAAAYWTLRLRRLGVSREDALLHAFGVHLAYEISSQNKSLWPVGHLPEKLTSLYKAQDLASAYWGAVYGASLADQRPFSGRQGLAQKFYEGFRKSIRRLFLAPSMR